MESPVPAAIGTCHSQQIITEAPAPALVAVEVVVVVTEAPAAFPSFEEESDVSHVDEDFVDAPAPAEVEFDSIGRVIALDKHPALFVPALLLSAAEHREKAPPGPADRRGDAVLLPNCVVFQEKTTWTTSGGRTSLKLHENLAIDQPDTIMRGRHVSCAPYSSPSPRRGFEPRGVKEERLKKRQDGKGNCLLEVRWKRRRPAAAFVSSDRAGALLAERKRGILLQRWVLARSEKSDCHLRATWRREGGLKVAKFDAPNRTRKNASVETRELPRWLVAMLERVFEYLVERVNHIGGRAASLLVLVFKLDRTNTLALLYCEKCVYDTNERPVPKKRLHVPRRRERRKHQNEVEPLPPLPPDKRFASAAKAPKKRTGRSVAAAKLTRPRVRTLALPSRRCVTSRKPSPPEFPSAGKEFSLARSFDRAQTAYGRYHARRRIPRCATASTKKEEVTRPQTIILPDGNEA